MRAIQERVSTLEEAIKRVLYIQQQTQIEIQDLKQEMKEFKDEMKAFKDEMKVFKDEMKAFKDEMKVFKDEMKIFKDEMKEFKDEMKAFKDEMKEFKDEMKVFKDEMTEYKEWSKAMIEKLEKTTQDMKKQWGDLARKMGTLVEDIFAPSIDIAIEKYFEIVPNIVDTRKFVRKNSDTLEIDILAISDEHKKAFVIEVKASPDKLEYIKMFEENLKKIPEFLPQLVNYEIIGIYAALDMSENTIKTLTKKKIFAMVVRGDILEIVNFKQLKNK